jgi:site-specific recombinase XerD
MKQHEVVDLFERMLSELSGVKRASQNTIEAYSRDINQFISFCQSNNISEIKKINEKTIRQFIISLGELLLSKSSISRKLSSLRHLFDYAIRNDLIDKNPIAKIPNPKVTRKLPETINLDSFLEIYRLIDKDFADNLISTDIAARTKAIFELLYGCAFRVSELCSLNIGDIDFHDMSIKVLGKGSKFRTVPIGLKSLKVIKEYFNFLRFDKSSQPLFVDKKNERLNRHYVYQLVKKYISRVSDIHKKSPHILRHSAATHMLDRDADIMAIKEILGHENLSTTQIYTHVSIERLKKSYKKAHPKS